MMVVYVLGSYATISTYTPIVLYVHIPNRVIVYAVVYTTFTSTVSFYLRMFYLLSRYSQ